MGLSLTGAEACGLTWHRDQLLLRAVERGVRGRVPSYHTQLIGRARLQALYRERVGGAIDRLPFPLLFTWGSGRGQKQTSGRSGGSDEGNYGNYFCGIEWFVT